MSSKPTTPQHTPSSRKHTNTKFKTVKSNHPASHRVHGAKATPISLKEKEITNLSEKPSKGQGQDANTTKADPAPTQEANANNDRADSSVGMLGSAALAAYPQSLSSPARTTLYVTSPVVASYFPLVKNTASSSISTPTASPSSTALPSASLSLSSQSPEIASRPESNRHLHTIILSLVVVGSLFLLVGALILVRYCTRHKRRRKLPTPSAPILQEDQNPFVDVDEKTRGGESPIFGGKDQLASEFSENLWAWHQYPQPNLGKSPESGDIKVNVDVATHQVYDPEMGNLKRDSRLALLSSFPTPPSVASGPSQPPGSLAQVQSAISRTISRLSMISATSQRNSLVPGGDPQAIGLAFDSEHGSPLTGDGLPARVMEKVAIRRASRDRMSLRNSFLRMGTGNGNNNGKRESLARPRDTQASFYAGAASPTIPPQAPPPPRRERVKVPYSGPSIRPSPSASTMASTYSRSPFEDTAHVPLPPLPAAYGPKSDERRARDTKAITAMLGMSSPPSPPMTIYPDDSLSVVGVRPSNKEKARDRVSVNPKRLTLGGALPSPSLEASSSLGHLMLNGFGTPAPSAFERRRSVASIGGGGGGTSRSVVADRPPRVPSPPPMPSLAQMAMENANPDDYANYSCPTYSIYGYYSEDRKSKFGA